MKKVLSVLMTPILLTSTISSVISYGQKKQLEIVLVPSKGNSNMQKQTPRFAKLITDKLKQIDPSFNYKVNVKPAADYTIAGQSLASGNEAIAFLQTKIYCENRGVKQSGGTYNKAAVLLAPTRHEVSAEKNQNGVNVQNKWENAISATESWNIVQNYNQTDKDIVAKGIKDKDDVESMMFCDSDVEYYRSCIYANKDFLVKNKFDIDNIKNEKDYIDKTKALILQAHKQGKLQLGKINSSASYTYPLKWMREILQFSDDELKAIIKSHTPSTVASSQNIEKLITGDEIVIAAGYGDIRTELTDLETMKQAYEKVQVIGAADAVANDAIQYSRKWFKNEQKLLKNLRKAFGKLVIDPQNHEIFNELYSHKNYVGPDENASEKEIAAWEAHRDEIYTTIENKFNEINKLIQAIITK